MFPSFHFRFSTEYNSRSAQLQQQKGNYVNKHAKFRMFDMNLVKLSIFLSIKKNHPCMLPFMFLITELLCELNALLSGSYHTDTSLHDIRLTISALHDVQRTKMRYFSVQDVNMPYSKGTISVVNKLQMEGSKAVRTILIGKY